MCGLYSTPKGGTNKLKKKHLEPQTAGTKYFTLLHTPNRMGAESKISHTSHHHHHRREMDLLGGYASERKAINSSPDNRQTRAPAEPFSFLQLARAAANSHTIHISHFSTPPAARGVIILWTTAKLHQHSQHANCRVRCYTRTDK